MTKVKICGLTNLADARCAARAGADYLGFIFYPPSPRYVPVHRVQEILTAIRAEFGPEAPQAVGVFVDTPIATVRDVMTEAGLDLVQLHGNESSGDLQRLQPYAFKALCPQTLADVQRAFHHYVGTAPAIDARPHLLIDAYHPQKYGGTGETAELTLAQWLAPRCRLMLAGGLTPDNVVDAIHQIQPWGVDVASGVERTKGVKDPNLIWAFIHNVRRNAIGG